ncbi:TetR family transcriptional regulator [Stackebrandtia albiflava]|uniref:TetR family transcriptional regulator n=1 Tax=Stackebrandtia albiflava TaxID=406432 RepID=A0A562VC82_9ACTN|nr:TetR family transcriptional regulator [Stackebrandtia albiflava]TWJ15470.1 TetR family transcriptional regulator [Stackebrandtia albiflava]
MTQPRPATRGPGATHDRQRHHILEAVFDIVDDRGTGDVTIRNVAKAAGISPGRVQHYFGTKDALLSEAFAAINDAGERNVGRRLAEVRPDDREAIVTAILTELVPDDDTHRRLLRVAQAFEVYALTRPPLARRLTETYGRLVDLVAGLLPADSSSTARELVALANGLGWLTVVGADDAETARRTVAARVRRVFTGS